MQPVFSLILGDTQLFLALDDLITATSFHHLLVVNSARAIEGLRHAIAPNKARSEQWDIFRANLNLDKDYIQFITDASASGRHGEGKFIPGNITEEILTRAWMIRNRFLEYKKRGDQPLPVSEFPTLSA